jgi:Ca-activated chloride channel family protein
MHFARPQYLYLLWMVPALGIFYLWRFRSRRRKLAQFVSFPLANRLTTDFSFAKAILRALFLLGFFTFAILALARPQWGMRLEVVKRRGVDIIAALDTSYSMNTEDVSPNRLTRAKSGIRTLVGKLRDDRVGLVAFAGTASLQCPLTLDYGAVSLFLDIADTETIPEPGTSLAAAIETATAAFIAKEKKYKALVLFTDGEDLEGQVDAAVAKARESGVIVYTVGVGTPEGKPIPVRNAEGDIIEYRKDADGQVVVSSLDERSLAKVASATGGRYFRSTAAGSEIEELYEDISRLEKKDVESRLLQNFEDRFQYPLAMAIAFLGLGAWITEKRNFEAGWFSSIRSASQSGGLVFRRPNASGRQQM